MKKNEYQYLVDKLDMLDSRLDDLNLALKLQDAELASQTKKLEKLEDTVEPLVQFRNGAMAIVAFVLSATGLYEYFKK